MESITNDGNALSLQEINEVVGELIFTTRIMQKRIEHLEAELKKKDAKIVELEEQLKV